MKTAPGVQTRGSEEYLPKVRIQSHPDRLSKQGYSIRMMVTHGAVEHMSWELRYHSATVLEAPLGADNFHHSKHATRAVD